MMRGKINEQLSSSVLLAFLLGLLLGPLKIPTCCWNTVNTLSITVPRGPTNSPGSAGSERRKYTLLINTVTVLQGKVSLYLTIKTNYIGILILRNTIYLYMLHNFFLFCQVPFIKPIQPSIRILFLVPNEVKLHT